MASGSGGGGRGRGRGAGGGAHVPALGTGIAARECESCRAAPGIPFCRVEWSFLCAGCASVVHGQSWIVAVPPSTTPVSGSHAAPYSYQHTCPLNPSPNPSCAAPLPSPPPNPNPSPTPVPNSNPGHVVQLSSDEEEQSAGDPGDDDDDSGGGKRRRPSSERKSAGREAGGEGEEGVAGGGELGRDSSEEARPNTVTASPSFEVEQFGAVDIDAVEEVSLL